jgi:hypothetical protein
MTIAKNKFQIGDKVKLTDSEIRQVLIPHHPTKTGIVTGFGYDPHLVRVKLDGLNKNGKEYKPDTYSADFWDKVEGQ